MIERNLYPALEFWTAQTREDRKKILSALHAEESMADHDFAGLPPQVCAGIAAGMPAPVPPPTDATAESSSSKTKGHK